MKTPTVRIPSVRSLTRLAVLTALASSPPAVRAQLAAPAQTVRPAEALAPATAVVAAGMAAPAPKPLVGKVAGVLTDVTTGEPLIGGQVGVQGLPLGNVSDENGAYYINNVPVGKQTFTVEYLGYKSAAKEHKVQPGASNALDFALEPVPLEAEEVVVEETSASLGDYVERTSVPTLQLAPRRPLEVQEPDTTLMEAWHRAWRNFSPLYSIEYPMLGQEVYFQRPAHAPTPVDLSAGDEPADPDAPSPTSGGAGTGAR